MGFRLKAIETIYDGHKFRSRLEARWAVFFNSLGIPYEYEKEGFDLGEAGRYLPDFWLPEQNCWVEIKGQKPNEDETRKAGYLSALSGKSVYIFWSQIKIPHDNILQIWGDCLELDDDEGNLYTEIEWGDSFDDHLYANFKVWGKCPRCGYLKIVNSRWDNYCNKCGYKSKFNTPRFYENTQEIMIAYTAAVQSRFEKGPANNQIRR